MQQPYFTIVIPTYNRADFIKKTIDSLLKQTFTNFEIIVVDDGSKDNTAEVMSQITDERVTFFPKANEERAVARNTGAQMGKGLYINFFDSDDLAYDNHLQEAYNLIEKNNNPEWLHVGYDVKDGEGKFMSKVDNFTGDMSARLIYGNFLSCNGVFVRKDIALQYPFNQDRALSASEDYDLWLRLASRFPLKYSNVITSTVINHDARSVLVINKPKLIERLELLVKYAFQDVEVQKKFGKFRAMFLSDAYTYIALHLALTKKHRADVLKYTIKAFFTYPLTVKTRRFWASLKHLI